MRGPEVLMRLVLLLAMFPIAAHAGGPILPAVPVLSLPIRHVYIPAMGGGALTIQDSARKVFLLPIIRFKADARESRFAKTRFLVDRKSCEAALGRLNAARKVAEGCLTYSRALEISGLVVDAPKEDEWTRFTVEGMASDDLLRLVQWNLVETSTGSVCSGTLPLRIRVAVALPGAVSAGGGDIVSWDQAVAAGSFDLPDEFADDRSGCEYQAHKAFSSLLRA
ncbi:MAG TPA: hypothetical protein VM598_14515 [Bdellovibrionota bacterium]|nr:hypothetical protein [Bdellovibrionota bacterium]